MKFPTMPKMFCSELVPVADPRCWLLQPCKALCLREMIHGCQGDEEKAARAYSKSILGR